MCTENTFLNFPDIQSTEIYDPAKNAWHYGPDVSEPMFGHCAVTLDEPGSKVLVIGGFATGLGTQDSTKLFDWNNQEWSDGGRMSVPRFRMTCMKTTLSGMAVVVVAGGSNGDDTWNSVEIYDINTKAW